MDHVTAARPAAQENARPGWPRSRRPGTRDVAPAAAGRPQPRGLLGALDRPLTSYYLVLGITALLLGLGLVMVLSTSSVAQLSNHASPYSVFEHQLAGVVVGLGCMWAAARSSPGLFRGAAYPVMFVALLGLAVVPFVGVKSGGVIRELQIGPFPFQPSELAKLGFVLWGADLLARKDRLGHLADWRRLLIPLLPGTAFLCLLVMLGDDLGTTFLLLVIFLALLWVVGTPGRLFFGIIGMIGLVLLILIVVAPYRVERLTSFLSPGSSSVAATWQPTQARYAVGSGGLFGFGLGAGRQKWGWVPNDTTDFIFAILGEELGLVGTLCVSLLYGGLAYAGLRIARRVQDTFIRLAAAGATAWIVMEAFVNIGAVIGLLPITGVPLPLISSGLSSLLVTMVALGMLLSFAKREPGAAEALAALGPGGSRRALSWLRRGRRRAVAGGAGSGPPDRADGPAGRGGRAARGRRAGGGQSR